MGPENSGAESLILYTEDGERIGPIRDLPEVTIAAGEEIAAAMCPAMAAFQETISISVKPGKRWRCRSRKRFIKLMMSEGISRNYAEWMAGFVRGWMPYEEAWRTYSLCRFWVVRM